MKIVTLSHYPISLPRHGGQRRLAAMHRLLRQAGHELQHLPLFMAQSYPEAAPEEAATAVPSALAEQLRRAQLREDLHLAQGLGADHPLVRAVIDRMRSLAPDLVHFEQPWLWPLFAAAFEADPILSRARLVYGAQNIESALLDPVWQDDCLAIEQALARRADLVIAVSRADAQVLTSWRSASARPVVVAPNGCWLPDPAAIPPQSPLPGDYALVTGSAHLPNATGYWDCIGEVPGFLPPDSRLVVVGGMSHLLKADPRFQRFRMLNEALVSCEGVVGEERLTALLAHAKVIALPIIQGGGTNLKTAEALMWLKPVVAMRPALRGYDEALTMSGVHVAATPQDFRQLMRQAMTGEIGSARRADEVQRYGWPAQLAPLVAAFANDFQSGGQV